MSTKNITIVKPGSGENAQSEAYDITIQSGNTGSQVMAQLNLQDFVLTKGDGKAINMSEDLFSLVENGEKIFATTPATVGEMAA